QSFAESNAPEFMDTYAQLLYKLGNKEEAIMVEQKAMDKATTDKESYQKTIESFKEGKKTWEAQY
ncbi:MAG: thioredoxin family protein, partial [Bacteroidota bacterium]